MKIKTRPRRNATGVFEFTPIDKQALGRAVEICLEIREVLANMKADEMVSDTLKEVVTEGELYCITSTLEVLLGNDKDPWIFIEEE